MAIKIICPHCKKSFGSWEIYARHILNAHEDDKERSIWAKHALEDAGLPVEEAKGKVRRKDV